jgi:tetrahydromethanopterin S-methyltransferase subunit B
MIRIIVGVLLLLGAGSVTTLASNTPFGFGFALGKVIVILFALFLIVTGIIKIVRTRRAKRKAKE